jgi:hypothetical protein
MYNLIVLDWSLMEKLESYLGFFVQKTLSEEELMMSNTIHQYWTSGFFQGSTSSVATLLWPSVGVKPNTWKELGFGILRDSRMLRARQKGAKHLA